MNFFSEKKTIYLWRIAMMEVQAPMPRCKVEDRWRLTDNIFAYDTFIYPKKSKSEPYELRGKEVNPKGGQL